MHLFKLQILILYMIRFCKLFIVGPYKQIVIEIKNSIFSPR